MTAWMILASMIGTLIVLGGSIFVFGWISERLSGTPLPGMIVWGFSWFAICAHLMSGGNWSFP